jgi:hypothetical protein
MSNLQGLNIIHPILETSPSDSRDLLLSQTFPGFSAQLDLWTHLNFESEEPSAQRNDEHKNSLSLAEEEEGEEARSPLKNDKATQDGHSNVVTPTNVASSQHPVVPVQNQRPGSTPAATTAAPQLFDLNALLSNFGLDAFAASAVHHPQVQQQLQQNPPSLAQLIALHSIQNVPYSPGLLPYPVGAVHPTSAFSTLAPFVHNTTPASPASTSEENYGSVKRARTRKPSIVVDSPEEAPSPGSNIASFVSSPTLTPLFAAEDKRRRNTAASARFRLKKKEREAALESKAKELETKVVELERECEGLRRENGWLKGLVVGVTGAAQTPSGQAGAPSKPSTSAASKRSRAEMEA